MLEHLCRRGHQPGGGLLSPSGVFYLNIPKNASTYITNILLANGWEHHNLNERSSTQKCIVVLRDPIDRWISGFATYASSWLLGPGYGSDHFLEDYNTLVERLIFDNIVFDDHTTPQSKFVEQLPNSTVTYFKLNKNIIQHISQDLNINLETADVDANISENNYDQRQITDLIRNRVDQDPVLKARVIEQYKSDFDLINSVQFYHDPR
jgi:hypothetical protein